jgi:hypothetical protein
MLILRGARKSAWTGITGRGLVNDEPGDRMATLTFVQVRVTRRDS